MWISYRVWKTAVCQCSDLCRNPPRQGEFHSLQFMNSQCWVHRFNRWHIPLPGASPHQQHHQPGHGYYCCRSPGIVWTTQHPHLTVLLGCADVLSCLKHLWMSSLPLQTQTLWVFLKWTLDKTFAFWQTVLSAAVLLHHSVYTSRWLGWSISSSCAAFMN